MLSLCGKGKARKLNWKHLIGLGSPGSSSEGEGGVLKAAAPFQSTARSLSSRPVVVSPLHSLIGWKQLGGSVALAETAMGFRAQQLGLSVSYASCSQRSERHVFMTATHGFQWL